ncbi:hypothetical protein VNO77_14982 [Canavalia gladiata]|uniref:Uncharacterized protein n=1 Tax=Canavalia gladiata TaxID=3824 RepID=A0AAN9QR04_CANGL
MDVFKVSGCTSSPKPALEVCTAQRRFVQKIRGSYCSLVFLAIHSKKLLIQPKTKPRDLSLFSRTYIGKLKLNLPLSTARVVAWCLAAKGAAIKIFLSSSGLISAEFYHKEEKLLNLS